MAQTVLHLAAWGLGLVVATTLMLAVYLARILQGLRRMSTQLHRHNELLLWVGHATVALLEETRRHHGAAGTQSAPP